MALRMRLRSQRFQGQSYILILAHHTFKTYLSIYFHRVFNGLEGNMLVPDEMHHWIRETRSPVLASAEKIQAL